MKRNNAFKIKRFCACLSLLAVLNNGHAQTNGDTVKTGKVIDQMVIDPGQNKDQMNIKPAHPNDQMSAMTDTGFINKTITDNTVEIELAKMGASKGNAEVKKIAAQLIMDHTNILNNFKKRFKGYSLTTPPNAPSIAAEPGSDFSNKWASFMLTMHDESISEMEKYLAITTNNDLRIAIGTALPKIRMHRQMLSKLPGAKSSGNKMVN